MQAGIDISIKSHFHYTAQSKYYLKYKKSTQSNITRWQFPLITIIITILLINLVVFLIICFVTSKMKNSTYLKFRLNNVIF